MRLHKWFPKCFSGEDCGLCFRLRQRIFGGIGVYDRWDRCRQSPGVSIGLLRVSEDLGDNTVQKHRHVLMWGIPVVWSCVWTWNANKILELEIMKHDSSVVFTYSRHNLEAKRECFIVTHPVFYCWKQKHGDHHVHCQNSSNDQGFLIVRHCSCWEYYMALLSILCLDNSTCQWHASLDTHDSLPSSSWSKPLVLWKDLFQNWVVYVWGF